MTGASITSVVVGYGSSWTLFEEFAVTEIKILFYTWPADFCTVFYS